MYCHDRSDTSSDNMSLVSEVCKRSSSSKFGARWVRARGEAISAGMSEVRTAINLGSFGVEVGSQNAAG